jgi:hypothetical protein
MIQPDTSMTHSLTFFSRLTTGFSSLTFPFPFPAAAFVFFASGFSSSLLACSSLTSFFTFLTLLVEALGLAAAFFFANGFSSSELSLLSLSLYVVFGFARPFAAPFDLRGAGFLAERGTSSSERSESDAAGLGARRFGTG